MPAPAPSLPDQILARCGLKRCTPSAQPTQGFLNTVHLAEDGAGQKYVLRIGRDENREDIEEYVTRQIKFLGAADLGATLHYRSIPAQAQFMQSLTAAGVNTPHIAGYGEEWMLMHFAEGRGLSTLFAEQPPEEAAKAAAATLGALMDVHKKGICLWDRWGGNELIDNKLNVCFIDFDLRIDFPAQVSSQTQTALDLAFMLRGCLQFSRDADITAAALAGVIGARDDFDHIYDVKSLSRFIDGQIRFYNAEYIENADTPKDAREKHNHENDLMQQLQQKANMHMQMHAAPARTTARKNTPHI